MNPPDPRPPPMSSPSFTTPTAPTAMVAGKRRHNCRRQIPQWQWHGISCCHHSFCSCCRHGHLSFAGWLLHRRLPPPPLVLLICLSRGPGSKRRKPPEEESQRPTPRCRPPPHHLCFFVIVVSTADAARYCCATANTDSVAVENKGCCPNPPTPHSCLVVTVIPRQDQLNSPA